MSDDATPPNSEPRGPTPEPRGATPEPPDSSGGLLRPNTERRMIGGTYLLTWTTHGSWLPGDERGFVSAHRTDHGDYVIHNTPGDPYDFDIPWVKAHAESLRSGNAVQLDDRAAQVCVDAFREVACRYGVGIHAGAVMQTHVHLLVSADDADGARLLHLFKGVSSRRLGQAIGSRPGGGWWTKHGSRRLLPTADSVRAAERYVREQPTALCVFDHGPGPTGCNAGGG